MKLQDRVKFIGGQLKGERGTLIEIHNNDYVVKVDYRCIVTSKDNIRRLAHIGDVVCVKDVPTVSLLIRNKQCKIVAIEETNRYGDFYTITYDNQRFICKEDEVEMIRPK